MGLDHQFGFCYPKAMVCAFPLTVLLGMPSCQQGIPSSCLEQGHRFCRVAMAQGCQEFSQHQCWGQDGHPKNWVHGLAIPFLTPRVFEPTISRMKVRWGWGYCGQLYPSSLTSEISTSTVRALTLTSAHPQSLYIELFTLDPAGTLQ